MAYSVDTTIQYRGYNTFKMIAPARVKSWMYGVEGLDTISHGLYAYATSDLPSAVRAKTRWINAAGITLSVLDHSFAIEAGLFSWIRIEAIPVPTGAVQAVTEIVNTSGATYWAGLIKTEAGDTATDFTENKAGQLTKITAAGIYTGTIQATQVVVANERLPEVLTSIQAGRITLSDDTKGKIAGMTVDTTSLTFSSTSSYFRITSDGVSDFIRAGTSDEAISFRVDESGKLYSTAGNIGGFTIGETVLRNTDSSFILDSANRLIKMGSIKLSNYEGTELLSSSLIMESTTSLSTQMTFAVVDSHSPSNSVGNPSLLLRHKNKSQELWLTSNNGLTIKKGRPAQPSTAFAGIARKGVSNTFVLLGIDQIEVSGTTYTLTRDTNGFLKAI